MRLRVVIVVALFAGPLGAAGAAGAEQQEGCTPTATRYVCLYGPIMVQEGENYPADLIREAPAPPEAGYVTAARATLLDGAGKAISRHAVHLHHVVWLNPNNPDMTCPFPFRDRFFGSGKERTPIVMPEGYGYYWDNAASPYFDEPMWAMNYHLVGHHPGEQETWIKLDLDFVPAEETTVRTPVTPVWLDVDNCSDSEFDVDKGDGRRGRAKYAWEFEMPQGGRFVALAGHLHDGGLKLKLRNVTRERRIFTSLPTYRRDSWDLRKMSSFSGTLGKLVRAGDVLKLTAVYDSTRNRPDVMGIMVGALAPHTD